MPRIFVILALFAFTIISSCSGGGSKGSKSNGNKTVVSAPATSVVSVVSELDTDGDGIPDKDDLDKDGDGLSDTEESVLGTNPLIADTDGDGVSDSDDAFPLDPSEFVDTDGDGIGDNADTDDDGDGVLDVNETALRTNPLIADTDKDGVSDSDDAFPLDSNESMDTDGDGIGDNADTDDDGDGVLDSDDAFPLDSGESVDTDSDGIGDNADLDDDGDGVSDTDESVLGTNPLIADTDGDGVSDSDDAFPLDPSEFVDTDGDGIGDNADTDDDGDGVSDVNDAFPFDPNKSVVDTDGDGVPDSTDNCPNFSNTFSWDGVAFIDVTPRGVYASELPQTSFLVEVSMPETDYTRFFARYDGPFWEYTFGGQWIPMRDDGTLGDKVAGDTIWSAIVEDIPYRIPEWYLATSSGIDWVKFKVRIEDENGERLSPVGHDYFYVSIVSDDEEINSVSLSDNNNIFATPYAVNVVLPLCAEENKFVVSYVGDILFEVYPKVFDSVMVIHYSRKKEFIIKGSSAVGGLFSSKKMGRFGASYHSNNDLLGLGFTHEWAHQQLCCFFGSPPVNPSRSGHWRYSDMLGGAVAPNRLLIEQANGDYLWKNYDGLLSFRYGDLTLWTAGLIPKNEVLTHSFFMGDGARLAKFYLLDVVPKEEMSTFSVDDIIGQYGERPYNPRNFRMVVVVVSRERVPDAVLTAASVIARHIESDAEPEYSPHGQSISGGFAFATGWRATMMTILPEPLARE